MARTPGQRGTFGNWLERVRKERYATQKAALAAYERLAGLKISESEYAQWESGSRTPRPDNPKVARLYEFYGSRPGTDLEPEPPASDQAALIAALLRQAESNDRLAAAIEAQARTQAEAMDRLAGEIKQAALKVTGSVGASAELLGMVAGSLGIDLPQTEDEHPRERTRLPAGGGG